MDPLSRVTKPTTGWRSLLPASPAERKKLSTLAFALALLTGAALWSWFQPQPGQFEERPAFAWPRWWLTALEENPLNRPPVTRASLMSVSVMPGSNGKALVAVGSGGTILHTADGGTSWKPQASGTSQHLKSVTFVNGESGWAVGSGGTVLHTTDGGTHWKTQTTTIGQELYGVSFVNGESGWVVGEGGTILHTTDGGTNWKAQASGTSQFLHGLTFVNAESGWAVGWGGTILAATDGGTNWKALASGTGQLLGGVTFVNAESGWAVGVGGTILHTTDGGTNWKAQASATSETLLIATFVNAESGWAVGDVGTILHTTDGGTNWKAQASGTSEVLWGVTFVNAESGWAVGDRGTILHTTDGGTNWKAQASGTGQFLHGLTFVNAESGWAVGFGGEILHTPDGGMNWKAQASGTSEVLYGVSFVNGEFGWVVGEGGTILHTTDGGANWRAQDSGTDQSLLGVTFLNGGVGWAVGDGGTILHTTDGGTIWRETFRYSRWPPPLFYLLVACAIPLLVWSATPVSVISRTRIEELVSSDSPVSDLKDDKLGQRALVERLTRFISNPNTSPPLVISLQARWGMGKSSVMRMLESNLKENRAAVTVWFNAWHHQKEDQLLAYLLETIQKEAVPPWLTAVGLSFRLDLLRVRLFSAIDRLAVVLLAIAFLALRVLRPEMFTDLKDWQRGLSWGGVALAGWIILQLFVAFKSNPDKLTEQSGGFLVHTLKELMTLPSLVGKSDVRQVFASNLKDVVEALNPQRLVIFLDDLDRCRPEQVIQILEAVNFLSSVAACVIVLGADYEKVEALAAMQFEPIALREEENKGARDAAGRVVALRVAYARNYLRKIVNLRLNLRLPTPSDYTRMMQEAPPKAVSNGKYLQRIAMVALLAPPILLTVWVSNLVKSTPTPISPPAASDRLRTPGDAGKNVPSAPVTPQANAPAETRQPPTVGPLTRFAPSIPFGDGWRAVLTFGLPGFIGFVGLIYWFSRPRRREQALDAESFAEALERRVEDICSRCDSPREVRRFLNYFRLIATGSGAEQAGDIDALRKEYGGKVDHVLVDLAALGETTDTSAAGRAVEEYYQRQCDLFGLDPRTFSPRESFAVDSPGDGSPLESRNGGGWAGVERGGD